MIKALLGYRPGLEIRNRAGLTPLDLARALRAGDIEALLVAQEKEARSLAGRRLMDAVRRNDPGLVRDLLAEAGAGAIGESDPQGFTPLLWAAREGFVEIVGLLLSHGADPNQNDRWMGANAGHKAAFWGRAEVMRLLIAGGLNTSARGLYNGYTALHDAVAANHPEVAKVLIDAGADRTIRGHDGTSPGDLAKASGRPELTRLFPELSPK